MELDKVKQLNGTLVEQNRQLAEDLGEERSKNGTIDNKLKETIATNQANESEVSWSTLKLNVMHVRIL